MRSPTLFYPVAMAIDPIELTRQLVRIPSTTYHEHDAGVFLADYLAAEGWQVERMAVAKPVAGTPGAEGGGERFNVYAHMPGQTPEVVLSTHFDTVPPFLELREDDEFLYGRGTCDAKGIAAAQIAAAERLRADGVAVALLFLVGEERDSAGAKVANQQAARLAVSDQRRAHRQPSGAREQGCAAGRTVRRRQDGALGLSRAGRVGHR